MMADKTTINMIQSITLKTVYILVGVKIADTTNKSAFCKKKYDERLAAG